jgi:hypothetical protein
MRGELLRCSGLRVSSPSWGVDLETLNFEPLRSASRARRMRRPIHVNLGSGSPCRNDGVAKLSTNADQTGPLPSIDILLFLSNLWRVCQ